MMSEATKRLTFWKNVFSGVSLEPRENVSIEGQSGVIHDFPIVAYSADERNIVLVAPQADPDIGYLIAHDVRNALADRNVSVVRPVIADTRRVLSRAALKVLELTSSGYDLKDYLESSVKGATEHVSEIINPGDGRFLDGEKLLEVTRGTLFEDVFRSIVYSREVTGIDLLENAAQVVREFITYEIPTLFQGDRFHIERFMAGGPQQRDIQRGVCTLPLSDFSHEAWPQFLSELNVEASSKFLREIGFHQFFRPPIDQSALALLERGVDKESSILDVIDRLDQVGHPHAPAELLANSTSLGAMFDKLREQKLTASGEFEIELTSEGKRERMAVKFQPREAVYFKILRQIPYLRDLVSILRAND